jgi:hypothetical protein
MRLNISTRLHTWIRSAIPVRSIAVLSCLSLVLFAFAATRVEAQISITTLNTSHTQNFDGMGTGNLTLTDDITGSLPGFHALRQVGNTNPNNVTADDGSDSGEGFKNYGPPLQLDRALGALPGSATGSTRFGIRFVNNSGSPVASVQITFTGEQWRNGGSQTPQSLVFAYRVDDSVNDLATGVYTAVPALEFVSPDTAAGATDLNGNLPANRQTLTATFAVSVLPGDEIMLRWEMLDEPGADHGLSVDDLSVTAQSGGGGPTAAPATIAGRVIDASGRGIARTRVVLIGGDLTEPLVALTNPFGYYRFDDVESGEAYILRIESKRYRFVNPVRLVNLDDNLTDVDFVASP